MADELNAIEKKVLDAMITRLGATSEDKAKGAEDITRISALPKGQVTNTLISLVNKKKIKRIARGKTAVYHTV